MFYFKKSSAWPLPTQARPRRRRHSRDRARRLTMEDLEERLCPSTPSIVITQPPPSFVAGAAPSPLAQVSMENSSGTVVANDGGNGYSNTYTLSASATEIPVVNKLYGDYYYEGTAQPASLAAAAALASNVNATFYSSLFSGTTYSGHDNSSVASFLSSDASSLSSQPSNALQTSYIDLKGYINVSAAEAGSATFNVSSDDRATLNIDGAAVLNTDNNNGSASVYLSAGSHTIEIQYDNVHYTGDTTIFFGGASLSASGTFANNDRIVPSTQASNTTVSASPTLYRTSSGVLNGTYYNEGSYIPPTVNAAYQDIGNASDTTTFTSTVLQGTVYVGFDPSTVGNFLGSDAATLQNPAAANDTLNTTYLDLQGTFNVTAAEAGTATFTLDSDDGSAISVDGTRIFKNDGPHAATKVSGTVDLSAGSHTIEIEYYNAKASGDSGTSQGTAFFSVSGTLANGDPVLPSAPANPALGPTTTASAGTTGSGYNGVANFNNTTLDSAGLYQLNLSGVDQQFTPSTASNALTPVTSGSFWVLPAQPSQLAITQAPGNSQTGQSLAPVQAAVEDQYGNLVSNNPVAVTVTASIVAPAVADSGFETPSLASGSFGYDPSGSPWTFNGQAGISANSSGFTSGNSGAPEGNQVAFIQNQGSISQSVNFTAGNYLVSFDAAQRGNTGTSTESVEFLVDGTGIGTFKPAGTAYSTDNLIAFTVTTGFHTIEFLGLNSTGDNTAFIDQVQLTRSPIPDAGFETPSVGSGPSAYAYDPSGSPWTFSATNNVRPSPSGAGITGNGSGFSSGNPNAPVGTQVAFIQGTGTISQSAYFVAGTYALTFDAAQRNNDNSSAQTIEVLVNGSDIGTITPSGTAYSSYTTGTYSFGNGNYTIEFEGLNPNGGDNTAFIDQVQAAPAPIIANSGFEFETPALAAGAYKYDPAGATWAFSGDAGTSANGTAFTSGNPNAPEGSQVAFIEETGSISQTVNLAAGTYALSFDAAERGNFGNSTQAIEVLVDGNNIGTITPTGTVYALYSTNKFTVTAGSHQITLQGLDPQGGDNTAFVDQVSVVSLVSSTETVDGVATFPGLAEATPGNFTLTAYTSGLPSVTSDPFVVTLSAPSQLAFTQTPSTITAGQGLGNSLQASVEDANGNLSLGNTSSVTLSVPDAARIADPGFETPSEGTGASAYAYDPSGSPWSFSPKSNTNGSGISGNGSGFTSGNPSAPQGSQVAFIQGTGSISQSVNFQAGNYVLMFDAAERGNKTGQNQSIEVLVDGSNEGTFQPASKNYSVFTTASFSVTAGSHTIELLGLASTGDNTAFIDQVSVVRQVSSTAVNGVATFSTLAIDTADTYTLTASASGLTSSTSSPITIAPASPAELMIPLAPGTTTAGTVWNALAVDVEDQYGNLATSATDSVTVALTSGSFASGSTLTVNAVDGVATFSNLEMTKPGSYTLVAKDGSFQTTTSFTVNPGAASQLVVGQLPSTVTAGQNLSPAFTVTEEDAFGNVLTTDGQTAVTVSTGAPIADPGFETPAVASGAFQYESGGSPWTFSATNNVQPNPIGAGISSNGSGFTSGNPNAPQGTQVAFLQGTGSITQSVVFVAGSYVLSFDAAERANKASTQTIEVLVDNQMIATIDPAGTSYASYSTPAFNVTAGPHTIEFLGLNPRGGDNTVFIDSVSASNASLAGGSTATAKVSAGVATFANLALDTSGNYVLLASADGLIQPTAAVSVTAAMATQLAVTRTPGTTQAGVALSPSLQVSVEDAFGNVVSTSSASVTVSAGGGVATMIAAQNGVATFSNLILDTAGAYTFTASANALNPASSGSFIVTPASASQLVFSQSPATTTTAGAVFTPPVQVSVEDQFGNLVTASTATITINGDASALIADGGFETPSEGSGSSGYAYDPSGSPWTFSRHKQRAAEPERSRDLRQRNQLHLGQPQCPRREPGWFHPGNGIDVPVVEFRRGCLCVESRCSPARQSAFRAIHRSPRR